MGRKKARASRTRRLHRSLGASAAVFILFMAFSGIAINHARSLGLDKHHVAQPFLLSWYGIDEPGQIHSVSIGDGWLSFTGAHAYFNGNYLSPLVGGVGAIESEDLIIVAGSHELLLIDRAGRLIERVAWSQPDSGSIESIGLLENGLIVIKTNENFWIADAEILQWQPLGDTFAVQTRSEWTREPDEISQAVKTHYRGTILSMEQLFLDLHSGRIFGTAGTLIYDLLALVVGFLAISGVVLWFRGLRNGKKKRSHRH
jgi:hypothetical protein